MENRAALAVASARWQGGEFFLGAFDLAFRRSAEGEKAALAVEIGLGGETLLTLELDGGIGGKGG